MTLAPTIDTLIEKNHICVVAVPSLPERQLRFVPLLVYIN